MRSAEADFDPLPFDSAAASLRRSGREPAARAHDAMIVAIAVAHDLPVHTCNPRNFVGIEGLEVVAVGHPDRVDRHAR